jgi:hypothetical protein
VLLVDGRGNCDDEAGTAGSAANGDLTARCVTLVGDARLLTHTFNKTYGSERLHLLKLEESSSYENVYSGFFGAGRNSRK